MSNEKKVKKWYVVMEWDDGAQDELYGGDLPENVTEYIEQYVGECEQYLNEGWELDYE